MAFSNTILRLARACFLIALAAHLVPFTDASANWNGPVDALIDQLASFLQSLGLVNAGVRPFGYGFEIYDPESEEQGDGGNLRKK